MSGQRRCVERTPRAPDDPNPWILRGVDRLTRPRSDSATRAVSCIEWRTLGASPDRRLTELENSPSMGQSSTPRPGLAFGRPDPESARAKHQTAGPSALHLRRETGSNGRSGIDVARQREEAMKSSNSHHRQSSAGRRSSTLALNPYFLEDTALTSCETQPGAQSSDPHSSSPASPDIHPKRESHAKR